MDQKGRKTSQVIKGFLVVVVALSISACTKTIVKETEYASDKQISYKSTTVDNKVIYELRKVFQKTTIEGTGVFESNNEGLARRTSINLAVAELAAQVQTKVRAESVIYNNKDVRDVVENRVHALVNNYRIDLAGYDPGTNKYRVRVSITGEDLVREIEKRIYR